MTDIREYLAHKPLLFDGGMGTYYKAAPGVECELANLTDPEGVKRVHAEYLAAGAQAIKTNTFGLPRMAAAQMPGWEELAEAGWKLACDAAAEKDAVVFACANPTPEIFPEEAKAGGARVVATGRSDYPNQINNVLAFPGVFRGALDVRASDINEEMKMAAARALAGLIGEEELSEENIIPKPFDPRVVPAVAQAVAQAARETGVARL